MLAYSRFLHSRKRTEEASSVLLFAWKEFEHSEFSMYESVVRLLKEIAVIVSFVSAEANSAYSQFCPQKVANVTQQ
jgi:hypothetical protein